MLAAPTTLPKLVSTSSSFNTTDSSLKYQKAFDAFDSPFHTPSLFGSASSTTPVTTNIKSNNNSYDASLFYNLKDDFRVFNYQHQQSTSPESFFSVMVDLESPGTRTPSPKNDFYDNTRIMDDHHNQHLYKTENPPPPFLYNNHFYNQRKPENNTFNDHMVYNNSTTSSFGLTFNSEHSNENSSKKDTYELVQRLYQKINVMTIEHEKLVKNCQNSISNKDLEYQDQSQSYEAEVQRLNSEIAMYQSFIKSKGLELPLFSGDMESSEFNKYNRTSCKLREYPETSKSMETTSIMRNESDSFYNTSRRWSEERSSLGIIANNNNFSTATTSCNMNAIDNKNVNSLVDRIVKENDHKASIFLQNKFKCATSDQKESIFKSILNQSYELMESRFGNFLIQKLLELGTENQIQSLADTMKGRILELTCEQFGCHVVQKALDHVTESVKFNLVSELFIRIPETITHKYACHVWQKVFEIRWLNAPPPIMYHIHKSLQGQWDHVALDETGSLVIQNIFENLTENDKRPIIDEVLTNAVSIAKGQWGNWVIQHILEQAEKSQDRENAFQIVVDEGIQLSMDQFASKVVEKALRIGGQEFISKFIYRISTVTCTHRPRMALIDIASDQYGNYVIQWLINNTCDEQKLSICRLIKRHMVSLRGSKYGQRVASTVEKVLRNNELTTYPLAVI